MNTPKNNEQNTLQTKELQKFLNKVKGVMLISKNATTPANEYPVLCLLVKEEVFTNFKDYGVNKHILDLLDNKNPLLAINIEGNSKTVGLSIIDEASGLRFKLPNQPVSEMLLAFLKATKYDDKIPLMLGFFKDDNSISDIDFKANMLLVLDGYVFE